MRPTWMREVQQTVGNGCCLVILPANRQQAGSYRCCRVT
jgi:hypothetical protein